MKATDYLKAHRAIEIPLSKGSIEVEVPKTDKIIDLISPQPDLPEDAPHDLRVERNREAFKKQLGIVGAFCELDEDDTLALLVGEAQREDVRMTRTTLFVACMRFVGLDIEDIDSEDEEAGKDEAGETDGAAAGVDPSSS